MILPVYMFNNKLIHAVREAETWSNQTHFKLNLIVLLFFYHNISEMIYGWMVKYALNSGISYFQLYAMVNKCIVLLDLSRIICIIADNYNNDPLLYPRTLPTMEMY